MEQANLPSSSKCRIAFIQSNWHQDIVKQGKAGFLEKSKELELSTKEINYFQVPGAFEIPLKCKSVCLTGKYDLVIAAGFIVNGGIYRHEFVANAVINGLMNVQLEVGIPILSMVLTPQDFDETQEKNDYFLQHFKLKGHEIAETAHSLLSINSQV